MKLKQRRIIDKREKKKFMIDDEYLDKMAKLCGWHGTIVYSSLCRHTNKDQECFPSISLMAEQHDVSRTTIIKGIEALKKRNVIDVNKTRSRGGKWLNNTYILLDKTEWNYSEVYEMDILVPLSDEDTESTLDTLPSPREISIQGHGVDSKETHGKETHKNKETHLMQNEGVLQDGNSFGKDSFTIKEGGRKKEKLVDIFRDGKVEPTAGSKLNEAIELFRPILPGDFVGKRTAFAKPPTREAVEALMERYTLDQLAELIWKYYQGRYDQYRPRVGTVYEFCTSKLAKIIQFVKSPESEMTYEWWENKPLTLEKVKAQEAEDREMAEAGRKYMIKLGLAKE